MPRSPKRFLATPVILGLSFIGLSVMMAVCIRPFSSALYLILYTLVGMGLALVLSKSADRTRFAFNLYPVRIGLSGGVALSFILYYWNPIEKFRRDQQEYAPKTSVSVFVRGATGPQDIILRKGVVLMDIGEERKQQNINQNGVAYFPNEYVGDSIHLQVDYSEPYESIYPDSTYIIPSNGAIYLFIRLKGIDRVTGTVLFKNKPLDSVLVRIDSLQTFTDKTGYYKLGIPPTMQRKDYHVWFIKPGYHTQNLTTYPETLQPLDVAMERN